jgi:hypothetical protein
MKSFITGSHAYGNPGPKSDIDLVVMVDDLGEEILRKFSEGCRTVRFGKLNLIICCSESEFAAWKFSTDKLKKLHRETGATFTKEAAHAVFEKDRQALGIQYKGDSGQDFGPEGDREEEVKSERSDPFDGDLFSVDLGELT